MRYHGQHEAGFTLLELLMVVFVVGIMAGLAVMSIGGNAEREFRRDVSRLQQTMRLAQDEAPFAGEELGFWLDPAGKSYRFLRFDDKELEWSAYNKEGFAEHALQIPYRLELEVDGDPLDLAEVYREAYKLDDKKKNDDEEKPRIPLLVFFSDGNYTPFRLWISSPQVKENVFVLEGNGLGDIAIRQVSAHDKPELSRE